MHHFSYFVLGVIFLFAGHVSLKGLFGARALEDPEPAP